MPNTGTNITTTGNKKRRRRRYRRGVHTTASAAQRIMRKTHNPRGRTAGTNTDRNLILTCMANLSRLLQA